MQFKHPELLWGLLLLLIPILIHLFQLRRFKKTPFTNVKFLKKVISESRRSSTLKKWLLLFTRLMIIAGLVIAFAQPFFAKSSALKAKETVIYLDDSFSMHAKSEKSTVFQDAAQQLLQAIPKDQTFSLFTNEHVFKNTRVKSIQNDLLALTPAKTQLSLAEIQLKANTLFSSENESQKNLIAISDFQLRMGESSADSLSPIATHIVHKQAQNLKNIAIDSVYRTPSDTENIELTAVLSANYEAESVPVSLMNNTTLIAKTSALFDKNKKAEIQFTLPKSEAIAGTIEIRDAGLSYDNTLFFNIDQKEKIKVLVVGEPNSTYLKRIYTPEEFELHITAVKNINYSRLNNYNLIILNELENISNALTTSLKAFVETTGHVVVIPASEINFDAYNRFVSSYYGTNFKKLSKSELAISTIRFSHPIYRNVFKENVTNFQYPKVSNYYTLSSKASSVLSFQNQEPFLVGSDNVYIFSAAISAENSNFKNSPLIVPTFYNMAVQSLKLPQLYQNLGANTAIDIPIKLPKDHILKVVKDQQEFIPQQKSFANKVTLSFFESPAVDGIYQIKNKQEILQNISFNYSREESDLRFLDVNAIASNSINESITTLFQDLQNDNTINALWKWFVILAGVFMLIEVLIQKYL